MEEKYGNLVKYFEVRKWIRHDAPDWETDRGNLRALALFIEFTGMNPKKLIKEWLTYCKKSRDDISLINHTKQAVIDFRKWLIKEKKLSKNSAINYIGRILGFYTDVSGTQVRFTKQEKKIFRRDRGKKQKTALNLEMIRNIVTAMRHNRNKAIMMCLKSSGMPIGDVLMLRFRDLEYIEEHGIYIIDFTRVKNEIRYITFFDTEATHFLVTYLKTEYPEKIPKELDAHKLTEMFKEKFPNDFVFISLRNAHERKPVAVGDVWDAFTKVAQKIGYKNVTPYTLRRFFTTQMKLAGMNPLHIDFATGHITAAVQSAYDDLISSPRELLLPLYLKYVKTIEVFGSSDDEKEKSTDTGSLCPFCKTELDNNCLTLLTNRLDAICPQCEKTVKAESF